MNRLEIKAALTAAALAAGTQLSSAAQETTIQSTPTPTQTNTTTNGHDLQRSVNINVVSSNGQTTRHVYNWQEVANKYGLEADMFSKDKKLSKELELDCAAQLRAIAKCEANNASAIEDKYYHDNLSGKITDTECNLKIKEATANKSTKSFSQLFAEERALLEKDKKACKEALGELEEFKKQNDLNKGIMLTDKVDAKIEQNSAAHTKTLSAAYFLKNMRQNA